MTAPSRAAPAPPEAVQAPGGPAAPGWEDESEAPHAEDAPPPALLASPGRQVTRLAALKALVARFEARHLGHRVAMHVARLREDDAAQAAPRWPDSFFEP